MTSLIDRLTAPAPLGCTHETLRTLTGGTCPVCPPTAPHRPRLGTLWRALLRASLAEFFKAGWHVLEPTTPLVWGPHLDQICGHVQAVIEDWARRQTDPTFVQRVRDLLVSIGPGTAKSRVGVYALAWAWLRWPSLRAICLSANPRVALRDAAYTREVIASAWYQQTFRPSWSIKADTDAKGLFANTEGGFRSAMGIDARIVGERADLLWIDDPHDPEEAQSDAQRSAVNERWEVSIANRVNDLGSSIRIGIAQRAHEDDWSSRRIAEGWVELRLPMEFEAERACTTPLGGDWRTVEGECLHPERFPPEVIAAEKCRGERRWATLYQQRPAPAGGALIKTEYLRFWRRAEKPDASMTRPKGCWTGPAMVMPKAFDVVAIACDLAGGRETKNGDFNVLAVVGRRAADYYLLEAWRERADFPIVVDAFRALATKYKRAKKFVEQAAAGGPLIATLQREISGIVAVPATRGKVERVQSVLEIFRAGNFHLDDHATIRDYAIAELTSFPASRFDDLTDAICLALTEMEDMEDIVAKWSKLAGDPRENARHASMTPTELVKVAQGACVPTRPMKPLRSFRRAR